MLSATCRKRTSPSKVIPVSYGRKPVLFHPNLDDEYCTGIFSPFKSSISCKYLTRHFAFSLVTDMPLLYSEVILFAEDMISLGTIISFHFPLFLYASFTCSSSVSRFFSTSTGITGCRQARTSAVPVFWLYIPSSVAIHVPQYILS